MFVGATVAVTLELSLGAKPITGSLCVGDGPTRGFRGWLELTSLLNAAAEDGKPAATHDGGRVKEK